MIEADFNLVQDSEVKRLMESYNQNLSSFSIFYDKYSTDLEFIIIWKDLEHFDYWKFDLNFSLQQGKLKLELSVISSTVNKIDPPPQNTNSSDVKKDTVYSTYNCQPSANFIVCGGMTSDLEPLLVYYRKLNEASPYMTFSLFSDRSAVPIDPTTAFVIQNYQNDIMGYVSPKSLTAKNIRLKSIG